MQGLVLGGAAVTQGLLGRVPRAGRREFLLHVLSKALATGRGCRKTFVGWESSHEVAKLPYCSWWGGKTDLLSPYSG